MGHTTTIFLQRKSLPAIMMMLTKSQRKEFLVYGWERENTEILKITRIPIALTNMFFKFYNDRTFWMIPMSKFTEWSQCTTTDYQYHHGPKIIYDNLVFELYAGARSNDECFIAFQLIKPSKDILQINMSWSMLQINHGVKAEESLKSIQGFTAHPWGEDGAIKEVAFKCGSLPSWETLMSDVHLQFDIEVHSVSRFNMNIRSSLKWIMPENIFEERDLNEWCILKRNGWRLMLGKKSWAGIQYFALRIKPESWPYTVSVMKLKYQWRAVYGRDNKEVNGKGIIAIYKKRIFSEFDVEILKGEIGDISTKVEAIDIYWETEIIGLENNESSIDKHQFEEYGYKDKENPMAVVEDGDLWWEDCFDGDDYDSSSSF